MSDKLHDIITVATSTALAVQGIFNGVSCTDIATDIIAALDAEMGKGALRLVQKETDTRSNDKRVMDWMGAVVAHVRMLKSEEAKVSRRQFMTVLYQLADGCEKALQQTKQ